MAVADNAGFYEHSDLIAGYSRSDLRPVEAVLFDRYAEDLAGRVLEVGCGGGRLIGHLAAGAEHVHGMDVSKAMVEHCRHSYPQATFERADMRSASETPHGPFDAVVAGFNVIDAVDDSDRRRTLAQFREVLNPGGLLIMSSHNLEFASRVRGPARNMLSQLRSGAFKGAAVSAARLPRSVRNHRRLAQLEVRGPGYALVNDLAHDYSLLHYYVSPARQVRQLAAQGFELLEFLDLGGRTLKFGDSVTDCSELHYVARLAG